MGNASALYNTTAASIEKQRFVPGEVIRFFGQTPLRQQFEELQEFRQQQAVDELRRTMILNNTILFLLMSLTVWILLYWVLKPVSEETLKREKFVAQASHELRTPLAIMKSELQLLEGEQDVKELQKAREKTLLEVERLNTLSNSLLSKLSTEEKKKRTTASVTIKKIIVECKASLEVINTRSVAIEILEKGTKPLVVTSDKATLYQLLFNLLDNMYRYATAGSKARIIIDSKNKSIILTSLTDALEIKSGIGLEIVASNAQELGIQYSYELSNGELSTKLVF